MMEINNSEIIVGLDIGTTKVSIIIGRRNQYNKIEILGNAKSVSKGVVGGSTRHGSSAERILKIFFETPFLLCYLLVDVFST